MGGTNKDSTGKAVETEGERRLFLKVEQGKIRYKAVVS